MSGRQGADRRSALALRPGILRRSSCDRAETWPVLALLLLASLTVSESVQSSTSGPRIGFQILVEESHLIVTGQVYETRVGADGSPSGAAKLRVEHAWTPHENPPETVCIVWGDGQRERPIDTLGHWLLFLERTADGCYRSTLGASGLAPISRCWDADPALSVDFELHDCLLQTPGVATIPLPSSVFRRLFVAVAGRELARMEVETNGALLSDLERWVNQVLAEKQRTPSSGDDPRPVEE